MPPTFDEWLAQLAQGQGQGMPRPLFPQQPADPEQDDVYNWKRGAANALGAASDWRASPVEVLTAALSGGRTDPAKKEPTPPPTDMPMDPTTAGGIGPMQDPMAGARPEMGSIPSPSWAALGMGGDRPGKKYSTADLQRMYPAERGYSVGSTGVPYWQGDRSQYQTGPSMVLSTPEMREQPSLWALISKLSA